MESKRSERLRKEALEEENDFRALSLHIKALREVRLERFEEDNYKKRLEARGIVVIPFDGTKITLHTPQDMFGTLDYFPKANKILYRKENKWFITGLKWINENLLI